MATQAVEPANSVEVCKVLQNSMALAASRPRVELSQHCKGAPDNKASAMDTRLRLGRVTGTLVVSYLDSMSYTTTTLLVTHSPPETPRTYSFPTLVLIV